VQSEENKQNGKRNEKGMMRKILILFYYFEDGLIF